MIRHFKNRALKRFFEDGETKGIRHDLVGKVKNILFVLNRAQSQEDMNLPGFRMHPLKGDLKGFWSVTVRANWRIIFRIQDGEVTQVDLLDYH